MMLQGKTVAPDHTPLCWHSPATTGITLEAENYLMGSKISGPPTMVYCFCQATDHYNDQPPQLRSGCSVISMLIYQLLTSKMRSHYSGMTRITQS